ncbi:MAG: type III-A CRISPR-associated protein Csm2 [Acholeplasmataceae bacterium]|jgi:CRISPR-associated protein Csm2
MQRNPREFFIQKENVNNVYNSIKNDYTKHADEVIRKLKKFDSKRLIKANQLRAIYALVVPFSDFFNYDREIHQETAIRELRKLKIKIAYQIGRDDRGQLGVQNFNNVAQVLELIDLVVNSQNFRQDLELYCNYFEALVAYHKYHGGQ